jgi:hypothetical protein
MQTFDPVWHSTSGNPRNLIDCIDRFAGSDIRLVGQTVGLGDLGVLAKARLVISHPTSSLKS